MSIIVRTRQDTDTDHDVEHHVMSGQEHHVMSGQERTVRGGMVSVARMGIDRARARSYQRTLQ